MNRKLVDNVKDAIGGARQSASIVDLDESNFVRAINESSVPSLVDFWAPWSGPCRMVAPVLDEIAKEQGENVKIAKVNVDEWPTLSSRFGIRDIPTLLFFKGGELKDQVVGLASKAELLCRLKSPAVITSH
jgi:thioredoxin 1